ncbi:unnamed protein product [Rhizophagus irregularis]|uniref:Uncharacterized protein n=1 Tax=Rhizophagus irregularis TaxID=588596 RepID=A0A915ZNW9_9GLOM|nr:unnamed protein product [Rhizophagus irregularis]
MTIILLDNISGQHYWTTFLDNISGQHFGQHFWTTLLDNNKNVYGVEYLPSAYSAFGIWTTIILLDNISGQHFWTTLLDNNKNVYGVEYLPSAYSWMTTIFRDNISGQQ